MNRRFRIVLSTGAFAAAARRGQATRRAAGNTPSRGSWASARQPAEADGAPDQFVERGLLHDPAQERG